jgi:hypothetical protein
MAEALGIGTSVIAVIRLTVQIAQVIAQLGLDWKDAPADVKSFMAELHSLKVALSDTNTNILLNPELLEAFQDQSSTLASQLGTAPSSTDTKLTLATCQSDLEGLLGELKRAKGHRVGWERLKGAFLAKGTRDPVGNLYRHCQTFNRMMSIDAIIHGATTYKDAKEANQQQERHQAETNISSAIKDGVSRLHERPAIQSRRQDCQAILDWLTPINYAPQQIDFMSRRQEGTGQWLLNSNEFQGWLIQAKQTLFCPGLPGAGKTMITAIVVEHLFTKFQSDATIGIAYIYCDSRRQHEQKPEDLLSSLLKQLLQNLPSIPESIKSLYELHRNKRTRPSSHEISKALHSIAADNSRTFVIIDALDECQVLDRWKFLDEVSGLQTKAGANFLATSRFMPKITKQFQECITLEIRARDADVQKYISGKISRLQPFVLRDDALQEEITSKIIKAVDGMYVL